MTRGMMTRVAMLVVGAGAAVVIAGPLDPPAGPIAPTGKVIGEVEPRTAITKANTPGDATSVFRITTPGSYYLTGNVQGESGKSGIVIAASGVTVDLNGFALTGVTGSKSGVQASASVSNLTVRNGTVEKWGEDGIALSNVTAIVEGVIATDNLGDGVDVGSRSVVRSCVAVGNGRQGISIFTAAAVIGSTASGNGFGGIFLNGRSMASGCVTEGNTGPGITGAFGAMIVDCTSGSNVTHGIQVDLGCRVSRCFVSTNGQHGILTSSDSIITDNACDGNGTASAGAGIQATGADNRIEGNNVTDNDIGIAVTSSGNFIARNTASGNTTQNWNVAANNKCLVVLGVNAGAIAGDSGGVSPGSTDPNANYTY